MGKLVLKRVGEISDGTGYIFNLINNGLVILSTDKILDDPYDQKLKWKIGVSLSSGCKVGCIYCFTNNYRHFFPLSVEEIKEQVEFILSHSDNQIEDYDEVKVCFKQMGDPMLNSDNTCRAISELHSKYPLFIYVVSTSGPHNLKFFNQLSEVWKGGADIRLQFSCHTTSDRERKILSPCLRMMTFTEISKTVEKWPGDRVTLNFVMIRGINYDPEKITKLFDPNKVFIKINYFDHNRYSKKAGLKDMNMNDVMMFVDHLRSRNFNLAYRHGHYSVKL